MAKLADNALLTVAEYLEYKGGNADDPDLQENEYTVHINAASTLIANYLDRTICPVQSGAEEIFDGDGTKDYYVKGGMITTLTLLEYWSGTAWTEMTTTIYPRAYDVTNGRIWFNEGHTFWEGDDNFRVTYTYGYAVTDVPAPIKLACFTLVQRSMLRAEKKEGISSESFGDVTTSYDLNKMPDHVKMLLGPYRRQTFGR